MNKNFEDFEDESDDENPEESSVELIASGYDWVCPVCDHSNHEIEVTEYVVCSKCSCGFPVSEYHHAIG